MPDGALRSRHSVPRFSKLASPSTSQVSSSTLKDKSEGQMVSNQVHMSASKSSQRFPNAKPRVFSQTTQANVSMAGSATSLANRNTQSLYKQKTTRAGTYILHCFAFLLTLLGHVPHYAAVCSSSKESSIFSASDFPVRSYILFMYGRMYVCA